MAERDPEVVSGSSTTSRRASFCRGTPLGLIDSFEDALLCCGYLDAHASETPHQITGWLPWLIVRYPL